MPLNKVITAGGLVCRFYSHASPAWLSIKFTTYLRFIILLFVSNMFSRKFSRISWFWEALKLRHTLLLLLNFRCPKARRKKLFLFLSNAHWNAHINLMALWYSFLPNRLSSADLTSWSLPTQTAKLWELWINGWKPWQLFKTDEREDYKGKWRSAPA